MRFFVVFLATIGLTSVQAQLFSSDPKIVPLVTSDIEHFWKAFDLCDGVFDPDIFQKHYLKPGSKGVKGFMRGRISSAKHLAKVIEKHKDYYTSIRASSIRVAEMDSQIRKALEKMKEIYPEATFPPVYFVVGALNSGGTTSNKGLIIGVDMYGKTLETPTQELGDWLKQVISPIDDVPYIVAHELIHYQQQFKTGNDLLSRCLKEGSADFIGELISGRHINEHVHEFADPIENELWTEFKERMHQSNIDGWLYSSAGDRPNDLGYWVGYKISKAYYDQAEDKQQAIHDILNIRDALAFLNQSGYMKGI